MVSQQLMRHSRLYEGATGKTREEGDMLVYHKGLGRKVWMSVKVTDAGSHKHQYWGTPLNHDSDELDKPLPTTPIKIKNNKGVYSTM